jgi:predicted glycosyltransferase
MSKILFFAHDPGGANAICSLIEPLKKEHDVFVYAKGPALSILPNPIVYDGKILTSINPDLVITGTSANDMTEKRLWVESRQLGILSIAILDHWCNYGIRFSRYTANEMDAYKKSKSFDYLPDYIVVMDSFAKKEMIKEGLPEDRILPLGNPHLENILNNTYRGNPRDARKRLGIEDNEFLIVFASEPCIEDYGHGNELQVIEDLLEITRLFSKKIRVLVRPHPREKCEKFSLFSNVIVDKTTDFYDSIMMSDLIISMTSMFLIEALVLGKTVLSYQLAEPSSDTFILTRNKSIPFITEKSVFEEHLKSIILSGNKNQARFDTIFNGIENVVRFVGESLCQKQY